MFVENILFAGAFVWRNHQQILLSLICTKYRLNCDTCTTWVESVLNYFPSYIETAGILCRISAPPPLKNGKYKATKKAPVVPNWREIDMQPEYRVRTVVEGILNGTIVFRPPALITAVMDAEHLASEDENLGDDSGDSEEVVPPASTKMTRLPKIKPSLDKAIETMAAAIKKGDIDTLIKSAGFVVNVHPYIKVTNNTAVDCTDVSADTAEIVKQYAQTNKGSRTGDDSDSDDNKKKEKTNPFLAEDSPTE